MDVREQQGVSEGHFWDSLQLGAAAETNELNTETAIIRDEIHRVMMARKI
jgi:hypothetical protein